MIIQYGQALSNYLYDVFVAKRHMQHPEYDPNANVETEIAIMCVAAMCWVSVLGRVIARYVMRVYYNSAKNQYCLVTYRPLTPWITRTRVVPAGSGRLLEQLPRSSLLAPVSGEKRNNFTLTYNCVIDGKKYLLFPEYFKFPVYFNVLFAHDDPDAIARLNDSDENADKIFRDRSKERHW